MYFNVNFNVFFLNKIVHLLVSELYIYQKARATIKKFQTSVLIKLFVYEKQTIREYQ